MKKLFAVLLAGMPCAALAQLDQTWVSGVGDDINDCSRTSPCRTVAGALPKTNAGGEITALDRGALGAFTVTKSITVNGLNLGGMSVASSGMVINAPSNSVVHLRGITMLGLTNTPGNDGLRVTAGGRVVLDQVAIHGFHTGINVTASNVQVSARDVEVRNPASTGINLPSSSAQATFDRTVVTGAQRGIVSGGGKLTLYDSVVMGNSLYGVVCSGGDVNLERSAVEYNDVGLLVLGAGSNLRLSHSTLLGNLTAAAALRDVGTLASFGNNLLLSTSTPGCPSNPTFLSPATLAVATRFAAYSEAAADLNALGTASWVHAGALPAGMSAANGALQGTPSRAGTFPIQISATDGNGCAAARSYDLGVQCNAVGVLPPALPPGDAGTPYALTLLLDGGLAPATWQLSSGSLPIGLEFDAGVFSGTPQEPGSFPVEVLGFDLDGCPARLVTTLVVTQPAGFPATATSLQSSGNPVTYGAPLVLTASVDAGSGPGVGAVTFLQDDVNIGSRPLLAGQASLTVGGLGAGAYNFVARFGGGGGQGASRSSPLLQLISQASTVTSFSLPATSQPNAPFPVVAQVGSSSGVPTGQVTFRDLSGPLASASLSGGTASGWVTLPAGTHDLFAVFEGSPNYAPSGSDAGTIVVSDAGQVFDAGLAGVDAGQGDGGNTGSGGGGGPSAGSDAGSGDPQQLSTCGCQGAGDAWMPLGWVALALAATRRRRAR